MSLPKIRKHINNLSSVLDNAPLLRTIPVILSDSKATYLEKEVNDIRHPENKIIFWCSKGARTEDQLIWLQQNLETKFEELSSRHLHIFVWIGTCDLTKLTGNNYLELRSSGKEQVEHICESYRKHYKFLSGYPTVKVVFLEIPYYSIYLWKASRGHPSPEPFRAMDKNLQFQVSHVNKFIRETNLLLQGNSPNFSLDLEKVRKRANHAPVNSFNFGLYLDGIHPCPDLARL